MAWSAVAEMDVDKRLGFWTLERETALPEAAIYLMIFYDLDEHKKLAIFHYEARCFYCRQVQA